MGGDNHFLVQLENFISVDYTDGTKKEGYVPVRFFTADSLEELYSKLHTYYMSVQDNILNDLQLKDVIDLQHSLVQDGSLKSYKFSPMMKISILTASTDLKTRLLVKEFEGSMIYNQPFDINILIFLSNIIDQHKAIQNTVLFPDLKERVN